MMKNTGLWIIFLVSIALLTGLSADTKKEEAALSRVQMTFVNNSRFPIYIHLYQQETLIKVHVLKPGKKFELKAEHEQTVQLEYPPEPYKTVLKPVDAINEISRTITLSNDGEYVKIKEKFKYQKNAKIKDTKKKKEKNPE